MKKRFLTVLCCFFVLYGCATTAHSVETSNRASESLLEVINTPLPSSQKYATKSTHSLHDAKELETFIDGLMSAQLSFQNIAGTAISIVKDGSLFFAKGYGYADLEQRLAVDAETTVFRPGSVSKLFTYTAVMQMVEQGKLDLDAEVNDYLTEFKIPDSYPEPVRVHHLLSHTTGFEESEIAMFAASAEELVPIGEFLKRDMPKRVRPVGQYASYSNHAVSLAGHLVEIVSGYSFDEYMEKFIFAPLYMNSSTFKEPLPPALARNLSNGYTYDKASASFKKGEFEFIHKIAPAGSMSATATDMGNFMIAHLQLGEYQDSRILLEGTVRKMHSVLYGKDPRINAMVYGFYEVNYNGVRMLSHGGDTGLFHSVLYLIPEHDIGVFITTNTAAVGNIRANLITAFIDRYISADKEPPTAPVGFAQTAQRYTGTYQFLRRSHSKLSKVLSLTGGLDVSVSVEDNETLLVKLLGRSVRYVETEPLLFKSVSNLPMVLFDTIAFGENESGEIHAIYPMPFMHAVKLKWYESTSLHQVLLSLCILIFFGMLISAFRQGKPGPLRTSQRIHIQLLYGVSALNLLFLLLFSIAVGMNMDTYLSDTYSSFICLPVSLTLPLISLILTVFLVYFTMDDWREGYWSLKRRVFYSIVTAASVMFMFLLHYWNLLGYQY